MNSLVNFIVNWNNVTSNLFIITGCFLILTTLVGMARVRDFYLKVHIVGISDSLGSILIILGLMLTRRFDLVSIKYLLLIAMLYISNPTSCHALSKAHNSLEKSSDES